MLDFLRDKTTYRKVRLFDCACCRQIWDLLDEPESRATIEVAERVSDGLAGEIERVTFLHSARKVADTLDRTSQRGLIGCDASYDLPRGWYKRASAWAKRDGAFAVCTPLDSDLFADASRGYAASFAARAVGWSAIRNWVATLPAHLEVDEGMVETIRRGVEAEESTRQCHIMRDIISNPFEAVVVDQMWRSSDVIAIADGAYDSRHLPSGTLDPERLAVLSDALEEAGCDNPEILNHLRGNGRHYRGCWVVDAVLGRS
jgi:hypothetical protein